MTTQQIQTINGVAPSELQELVTAVSQDVTQGQMAFQATPSGNAIAFLPTSKHPSLQIFPFMKGMDLSCLAPFRLAHLLVFFP